MEENIVSKPSRGRRCAYSAINDDEALVRYMELQVKGVKYTKSPMNEEEKEFMYLYKRLSRTGHITSSKSRCKSTDEIKKAYNELKENGVKLLSKPITEDEKLIKKLYFRLYHRNKHESSEETSD